MQRTPAGPAPAASGSASPYAPGLADSEGLALPLSSTPSGSYLPPRLLDSLSRILGERSDEDLQLRLTLHIVSGCGSPQLFPSAARSSPSDGGWIRPSPLGIVEFY